jgi:hypothetical protein
MPDNKYPRWDTVHGSHQSKDSHKGQGTDTVFRPRGQSLPGQQMTEEELARRNGKYKPSPTNLRP